MQTAKNLLSIILAPHLSEVSRGWALIADGAARAGFAQERVFDIQVACSEVIANAIERSPVKGEVKVRVWARADRLEVEVEGPGEFQAPDRLGKRETRGLDLPLMAKLSDRLALYSGPAGGTLATLTFYLPGAKKDETVTPRWASELLEENEFVEAITKLAPVGLCVIDPDLRLRWANAAFRECLEEPHGARSVENASVGDVLPGSATAGVLQIIRQVSQTDRPAFFPEYEFISFARGITCFRWESLPLKRERVAPPFDVLLVMSEISDQVNQRKKLETLAGELERDIARRRQAEESLAASKRRSDLLADTASRLLQSTDPQALVEDLCSRVMSELDCQCSSTSR